MDLVYALHHVAAAVLVVPAPIESELVVREPIQFSVRRVLYAAVGYTLRNLGVGNAVRVFRMVVRASVVGDKPLRVPLVEWVVVRDARRQVRPLVPVDLDRLVEAGVHVRVAVVRHHALAVTLVHQVAFVVLRVVHVVVIAAQGVADVGELQLVAQFLIVLQSVQQ